MSGVSARTIGRLYLCLSPKIVTRPVHPSLYTVRTTGGIPMAFVKRIFKKNKDKSGELEVNLIASYY